MSTIKRIFKNTMWISNPIAYQVLGVCSALAVTVQLENGLVMGAALTIVVAFSNLLISLMRNFIPHRIRIIIELVIISALVIIVDQFLQAYLFDVSRRLSVFVGLIITNCIVMGRAEAFAMANGPWLSFWDGIGNGLGYAVVLVLVGGIREIFGSGSLLGIQIVPEFLYSAGYVNNGLMVLPPFAFILLGLIVWIAKTLGGAHGEES